MPAGQNVLFSWKQPPLPNCNTVQSPYAVAKQAEYDRDYDRALEYYWKAMLEGDRADSAVKDYATVLDTIGDVEEAIRFLKEHRHFVTNLKSYRRQLQGLIDHCEARRQRSITGEDQAAVQALLCKVPRTINVRGIDECFDLTLPSTLQRLVANPPKVQKVIVIRPPNKELEKDASAPQRGILIFATNSAARKATYGLLNGPYRGQVHVRRANKHIDLPKEDDINAPVLSASDPRKGKAAVQLWNVSADRWNQEWNNLMCPHKAANKTRNSPPSTTLEHLPDVHLSFVNALETIFDAPPPDFTPDAPPTPSMSGSGAINIALATGSGSSSEGQGRSGQVHSASYHPPPPATSVDTTSPILASILEMCCSTMAAQDYHEASTLAGSPPIDHAEQYWDTVLSPSPLCLSAPYCEDVPSCAVEYGCNSGSTTPTALYNISYDQDLVTKSIFDQLTGLVEDQV